MTIGPDTRPPLPAYSIITAMEYFGSPPSSPAAHLALLAAIARWAKVPGRVDELARAGGKREILSLVEPVVAPATGERTAR